MKARIFTAVLLIVGLMAAAPAAAVAQQTIDELKNKIIDLQNKGKLGFKDFTLCSQIIGYGQYVPMTSNKVKAGSEIYFYYEPVNLFTNRVQNSYQLWFTQDMIVLDKEGEELLNKSEALNFNYKTSSPVMDVFASNTLNLGNLPPGMYTFKAVIHDKYKKQNATYTYNFEVIP